MGLVCPQDVTKMFLKQAWMIHWKKWEANTQVRRLESMSWLEAIQAMLRRKTTESWTDEHRNVMRNLVVEKGWMQKRMYDIGWSDEKKCQECSEEAHRSTGGTTVHPGVKLENQFPERLEDWEPRATSRRMTGSGKEATRRSLSAEAICQSDNGSPRSSEIGTCQSKVFVTLSPPMVLREEFQAGGVHAGGQWCG